MTEPAAKRPKRDNGESWIADKPNSRGYYEAHVWMGTRANGRPDRRHLQHKSLRTLKAKVKQLEADREAGLITKTGKAPTVREMIDRHLDVVLPSRNRSPQTIRGYRSLAEHHIYPRWGGQRADRLTPEHIEEGLADMPKRGLAPASVRKVYALLTSAYQLQVERGNLRRNPCVTVVAPEAPDSDLPALTNDEAGKVLAVIKDRPNAARWLVGLGCGLRQGEALGLRWEYVNLDTGEVRVRWQIQRQVWRHGCDDPAACAEPWHRRPCPPRRCPKVRVSGRRHVCVKPDAKGLCPDGCLAHAAKCPKRSGGGLVFCEIKERRRKKVWLDPAFRAALKAHRDAQVLQALTADREWEDHGLVFCQWNGRPIDPRADWGEWNAILAKAGLPKYRVHALRHSAATFMIREGVDISVVQTILGHSDIRVTQRYIDVNRELAEDASARMGRVLKLPLPDPSE